MRNALVVRPALRTKRPPRAHLAAHPMIKSAPSPRRTWAHQKVALTCPNAQVLPSAPKCPRRIWLQVCPVHSSPFRGCTGAHSPTSITHPPAEEAFQ